MAVYEGNEKYIFVSYAHADSAKVVPIINELQKNGFRVWYDSGIEAGTEWQEYIGEHLLRAQCVLAFMSPNAAASRNCRNEINMAFDEKVNMLVAYLQDTKLSPGLKLTLNSSQAFFCNRHATHESMMRELMNARLFEGCRKAGAKSIPQRPVHATEINDLSAVTSNMGMNSKSDNNMPAATEAKSTTPKLDFEIVSESNGHKYAKIVRKNSHSKYEHSDLIIPDTYNGIPVEEIDSQAFSGCSNITNVRFGKSIKMLSRAAFSGCYNLKSIFFEGNGPLKIEQWVFNGCSSLTEINLPDVTLSIGERAFENCKSLKRLSFGDCIEEIGKYAFSECIIDEINFPDTLQKIDDGAFNCCCFDKLTIPETVKYIGYNAFGGCKELKEITLPFAGNGKDNHNFAYIFGVMGENGHFGNDVPASLIKVEFNSECTLMTASFKDCNSLKVLSLGKCDIEPLAFCGCRNISLIQAKEKYLRSLRDFFPAVALSSDSLKLYLPDGSEYLPIPGNIWDVPPKTDISKKRWEGLSKAIADEFESARNTKPSGSAFRFLDAEASKNLLKKKGVSTDLYATFEVYNDCDVFAITKNDSATVRIIFFPDRCFMSLEPYRSTSPEEFFLPYDFLTNIDNQNTSLFLQAKKSMLFSYPKMLSIQHMEYSDEAYISIYEQQHDSHLNQVLFDIFTQILKALNGSDVAVDRLLKRAVEVCATGSLGGSMDRYRRVLVPEQRDFSYAFENAVKAYAIGVDFKDVLALIDTSPKFNGKSGFILTSKGIAFKCKSEKLYIKYSEIESTSINEDKTALFFHGNFSCRKPSKVKPPFLKHRSLAIAHIKDALDYIISIIKNHSST